MTINLLSERSVVRRNSYVYFIATGDLERVKIGLTVNPTGRLRELQIGSPERLYLIASAHGDRDDERKLHEYFRASRLIGEWFHRTEELMVLLGLLNPWRIHIPIGAADVTPLRSWFRELIARADSPERAAASVIRRL